MTETDKLGIGVVTETYLLGTEVVTEMDQVGVEADKMVSQSVELEIDNNAQVKIFSRFVHNQNK